MILLCLDVLEVLISWAIDGVTMSKALAQPEAVYKVKHIKLGVLLVEKLLSCNAMIARLLLVSMNYLLFVNK